MAKKAEKINVSMCIFCAHNSIFKDFVDGLVVKYIPVKYIDFILIKTTDDILIRLESDDVEQMIAPEKFITRDNIICNKNNIKDIKIFINLDMLEYDVNSELNEYLGHLD